MPLPTPFDHEPRFRSSPRAARILLHILALGLLAAAAPAQAQTWTLDRVLDAARRSDPGMAAARAAGEAGTAEAASRWSALSPRVGVDAGFTRSDDPALLFSQKLWQGRFTASDFALPALNDPAPRNAWNWGVTAEQPLWNGGAEVTTPALVAHRSRAARAAARAAAADRLLDAAGIYVEAIRARDALAADSAALAAAEEGRRAAAERFQQGQVPELDTLRATTHWAESRLARLASSRRLTVALARLGDVVGERVPTETLGSLPDVAALHGAAASAGVDAARRGEIEAAREEASARGIEATRASLALLPSINARADVRHYEDPETGGGERRFFVGLTASLPIWDGLRRIEDRRAARARAREAAARAEQLLRSLKTASVESALAADEAMERRDTALLAAASAEEALRLAQARYRAGLLPQSDLLAVDAEAARARLTRVEAESEAVLAQIRLMHARGVLE